MKLVKPYLVKRLRTNSGLGFLIVLSIAFHGLLLLMPMPQWWLTTEEPESQPEPEDILEESGAISLTTLPTVEPPEPETPPKTVDPPEVISEILEAPPLTEVPEDISEIIETFQEPEQINDPPTPPPEPPLEEPPSADIDNTPEAGVAYAFDDGFPHAEGAVAGCGSYGLENCRTVEGKGFNDIANNLRRDLEDQGYKLEDVTPEDDDRYNNHTIYKILYDPNDPDADVKYLNVFGEGIFNAFYIITPEIITREDLEELTVDT